MPLSISLRFSTIIESLKDGTPLHWDLCHRFMLLVNRISAGAGVEVNFFRPDSYRTRDWHIVLGNTFRESRVETATLYETHPHRFAADFISPVYYEANRAGWKDDVSLMLSTVDEHVYWGPNPAYGLHTYVRLGRDEAFTLPQLKRIAMLVCRFEEAIDTLPAVQRMLSNKDYILSNRYNPIFRSHTLAQVYSLIQAVTQIPELRALLNKRHTGKNTSPTEAYPGYADSQYFKVSFATIELDSCIKFIQYEGTTSAEAAIKWAEFVLRFVGYAMSATEAAVMSGGNTVEDLARLVGLP